MGKDICGKFADELLATTKALLASGKGLLAADESTSTIGKRFDDIQVDPKVENVEENRRAYRDLLFTAEGMENYISGVIMYEETLYQKTANGQDFTSLLKSKGVVSGIKVDRGVVPIPGEGDNTVTEGFDGLAQRLQEYYARGARFTKWRAVIQVSSSDPSEVALALAASGLARYAAICQNNGLVPVVEPETLVLEGDHSIERSYEVTLRILIETFKELQRHNVSLERMILKPNFVLPGKKNPSFNEEYKRAVSLTLDCLKRSVPPAVQGIMFLSGGLSEEQSVQLLNDLNVLAGEKKPWVLSYSYGRALQASTLQAWGGKTENVPKAQEVYLKQAKLCSLAEQGKV